LVTGWFLTEQSLKLTMPSITQVAATTAAVLIGSRSALASSETQVNTTAALAVNQWVIYQSFDWLSLNNRGDVYNLISSQSSALSGAGINAIWFPPPSQSVDVQGYLPQQWYTLVYESALKSAISTINGKGMVAIADVVVNHRTAPYIDSCTGHYTSFANPSMGNWAVTKDDENCAGKADACGCGNYDTGDIVPYAPDLDHTNGGVQQAVKDYLNFLKGYNFGGWRFDLVKGYSASYAGSYISSSSPQFSVGEYWDGNTNLVRKYTKKIFI
jgi:alpha-amylase